MGVHSLNAIKDDDTPCVSATNVAACNTLQCARDAAAAILNLLVGHSALHMPAAGSLQTALRAPCIRAVLAGCSSRGLPLERWLHYIAAADTAARHLTPAAITDALDQLT